MPYQMHRRIGSLGAESIIKMWVDLRMDVFEPWSWQATLRPRSSIAPPLVRHKIQKRRVELVNEQEEANELNGENILRARRARRLRKRMRQRVGGAKLTFLNV